MRQGVFGAARFCLAGLGRESGMQARKARWCVPRHGLALEGVAGMARGRMATVGPVVQGRLGPLGSAWEYRLGKAVMGRARMGRQGRQSQARFWIGGPRSVCTSWQVGQARAGSDRMARHRVAGQCKAGKARVGGAGTSIDVFGFGWLCTAGMVWPACDGAARRGGNAAISKGSNAPKNPCPNRVAFKSANRKIRRARGAWPVGRQGKAYVCAARPSLVVPGSVRRSRHGLAHSGRVSNGWAEQGAVWLAWIGTGRPIRHCTVRSGLAGKGRFGSGWQGIGGVAGTACMALGGNGLCGKAVFGSAGTVRRLQRVPAREYPAWHGRLGKARCVGTWMWWAWQSIVRQAGRAARGR
jgi:hypothetical protein